MVQGVVSGALACVIFSVNLGDDGYHSWYGTPSWTDAHFIYKYMYPNHSGSLPANACRHFLLAGKKTEQLGCPGMVLHLPLSTSISGDSVAAKWCRVPERVPMSIRQNAASNIEVSEVSEVVSWVGNLSQLRTASSPEASLRSAEKRLAATRALEDLTARKIFRDPDGLFIVQRFSIFSTVDYVKVT